MKELIIVRGLPSSGKSTFATMLGRAICCADDYFMHNGEYQWKAEEINNAHNWCQRKCKLFMNKNIERIIIANTNTTEKEMLPYINLATQFNYKIFSIIVETRHNGKNSHNVPETTLEKMRARFSLKL